MTKKTAKTAVFRPPKALRGRRARMIWRRIAPIATENGTLTAASEPLMIILCCELAHVYVAPDEVFDGRLKRMRDLARAFGILK